MIGVFSPYHATPTPGKAPVGFVVCESGCWEWIGARTPLGYGRVGTLDYAHRKYYERAHGAIPDGMDLDHLCRNPSCVRPDHLEPVTRGENLRRGATLVAINTKKTHCPKGHPYSPDNTYRRANGNRHCRTCVLAQQMGARRRQKCGRGS